MGSLCGQQALVQDAGEGTDTRGSRADGTGCHRNGRKLGRPGQLLPRLTPWSPTSGPQDWDRLFSLLKPLSLGHFVHSSSRKPAESLRRKQGLPVLSAEAPRGCDQVTATPAGSADGGEGEQEGRPSGRSARRRTSCWGHGAWGGASSARGKSAGRPGRQPVRSAPTRAVLGCATARLCPISRPASACASRSPAEPRPRAGCRGGRWVSPRDGRGPLLPAAQKHWPLLCLEGAVLACPPRQTHCPSHAPQGGTLRPLVSKKTMFV